jgi:hypothetical protein
MRKHVPGSDSDKPFVQLYFHYYLMKITKSTTCSALIGASLLITPSLFAQIVTSGYIGSGSLYITAPNYSTYGDQAGPYVVSDLTSSGGVAPSSSTFETFCIGSQVDYTPGNTYSYQISEEVQPASGVGSPGYVTWGTAYLYNEFLSGAAGFTGSLAIDDALQAAIWHLQDQSISGITFSGPINTTYYDDFLADAANAASGAGVSDGSDADGAFGVYALNMYSGSSYVQPELVQIPTSAVPEPTTVFAGVFAGALLLLPFGRNMLGKMRALRKQA